MVSGVKGLALAISGVSILFAASAEAKPPITTSYTYYTIAGNSPADIYDAMLSRGPRVGGVKASATTTANTTQSGRLLQGPTCKVADYSVAMNFTIRLPKLKNAAALSGPARSKWNNFSAFLKAHEEQHRAIWLGCRSTMQAKVAALKVKNCGALNAQTAKLWAQVSAACNKKHMQLDDRDQARLLHHPFIQTVMAGYSNSRQALVVSTKKKKKRRA